MPSNSRTDGGTWSSSSSVDQVVGTELQIQVSSSKRLGPGILRRLDAHGCGSDLRSARMSTRTRSGITGFGTNLFLRHGPGVLFVRLARTLTSCSYLHWGISTRSRHVVYENRGNTQTGLASSPPNLSPVSPAHSRSD